MNDIDIILIYTLTQNMKTTTQYTSKSHVNFPYICWSSLSLLSRGWQTSQKTCTFSLWEAKAPLFFVLKFYNPISSMRLVYFPTLGGFLLVKVGNYTIYMDATVFFRSILECLQKLRWQSTKTYYTIWRCISRIKNSDFPAIAMWVFTGE